MFELWYIIVGTLLLGIAALGTSVKRLPVTSSLLYLLAGFGLGPHGLNLIRLDPVENSAFLERLTEFAVILSLFIAGLKMREPLSNDRWRISLRLASISMVMTVGLIAAAGVLLLGLPMGLAVLLGAVLAPTDPVLASDVQVKDPDDHDRLRFGLTGEAGFNDGTAFPFVMLGLGLVGLHELGTSGWRWLAVDVVWAIGGGLAIGAVAGWLVGRLVLYLRWKHKEAIGLDEFLALGLLMLAYGVALYLHTYGFLAAFAAGVSLRRVETNSRPPLEPPEAVAKAAAVGSAKEVATAPETAPAYMARAILGFDEQIERLLEVGLVVLIGSMLTTRYVPFEAIWFVPLLFLVIRPIAVYVGLIGSGEKGTRRRLFAWFGIRGIGSVYYLMYAIEHGVKDESATALTAMVLTTIAASILIHGISVTPLMNWYRKPA